MTKSRKTPKKFDIKGCAKFYEDLESGNFKIKEPSDELKQITQRAINHLNEKYENCKLRIY